jgi:hypothetical protein
MAGNLESIPDPWGVRRAENLLTTLEGVLSARVVTTPLGEVSEIHILAQAGLQPKQVVRNIESALLAHLGVKVDHRKISVAQTADVKPIEALEQGAVRAQALRRVSLFGGLAVAPSSRGHRVKVSVTLTMGDRTETRDEEVADTPRMRVEGAARATVAALESVMEKHSLILESARVVSEMDREIVLVVVRGVGGRESVLLTGTAAVRENAEQAAVLAVMDATNRWVGTRRSTSGSTTA